MSDIAKILETLGVVEKEDVISNLLCHAFKTVPCFRKRLLQNVRDVPGQDLANVRAKTRVSIPKVGVPDIILTGTSGRGSEVILIENKLGAGEGKNQTVAYATLDVGEHAKGMFDLADPVFTHFVFLTLISDQGPRSKEFTHVTYQDLFESFDPDPSSITGMLLDELREHLKKVYSAENVGLNDQMARALDPTAYWDAGYLAFRAIIKHVELPPSVRVASWYRGSARGRRHYGALIRPDHWAPAVMDVSVRPVHDFDPRRHLDVHFEPQVNALSGQLTLYLHYEISPYRGKKWAEKNLPARPYEEYQAIRSQFYSRLREALPGPWQLRKGSNMLAKVAFAGTATVRDVVDEMTEALTKAKPVVDDLLDEVVVA